MHIELEKAQDELHKIQALADLMVTANPTGISAESFSQLGTMLFNAAQTASELLEDVFEAEQAKKQHPGTDEKAAGGKAK